jgi:hypothetical protein
MDQNIIQRTLGNEQQRYRYLDPSPPPPQAFADEIVEDLLELIHAGCIRVGLSEDGFIQRVGEPGLKAH